MQKGYYGRSNRGLAAALPLVMISLGAVGTIGKSSLETDALAPVKGPVLRAPSSDKESNIFGNYDYETKRGDQPC